MNVGSIIVQIIREWAPFSADKRAARKAKRTARRAKRDRQPDEAAGEFFQPEEDKAMLTGYKTYLGIATAGVGFVLGLFGIGDSEASTLAAQIIGALDQVLTVFGLALATYGRAKANTP